jgi:antitoxin (DNA-binding transcriptional repressor) of toxin-antitoxin stability system
VSVEVDIRETKTRLARRIERAFQGEAVTIAEAAECRATLGIGYQRLIDRDSSLEFSAERATAREVESQQKG